jgi:probable phosphoglycerate mutase
MCEPQVSGRFFIARHGETVFNAAARIQGETVHTPLTRAGFAQAEAVGDALRDHLGPQPTLQLWASDTGRALQTLAIIAEQLKVDWHQARTDARLGEIGMGSWGGRYYRDVIAEAGQIFDPVTALFTRRAPEGGESYADIAARLRAWLNEHGAPGDDKLVITHGFTSRVLRGLLTGAPCRPGCGAPIAEGLPQGSIIEVTDGVERVLLRGDGGAAA